MAAGTIEAELAANRARFFVGRAAETEAFDRLVSDGGSSRVYFVHGAGGIGKTTLLRALAARAVAAGFTVARCDARNAPAEPGAARKTLDATLAGAGADRPTLLMVDNFEGWAAIEGWFRDEYLAALPTRMRVVVAGRRPPGLRWRTDPGWHGVLEHRELAPLSGAECREYLRRREVAENAFDRAADASRGLPLLLALIADALDAAPPGDATAVVEGEKLEELLGELAEHLVPEDTHPEERAALYLASLTLYTRAPLLAEVLGIGPERAAELQRWLAGLSFVETGPRGLFPPTTSCAWRCARASSVAIRHCASSCSMPASTTI